WFPNSVWEPRLRETLFREQAVPEGRPTRGILARNGVSRTGVPKQSLGTRKARRRPEPFADDPLLPPQRQPRIALGRAIADATARAWAAPRSWVGFPRRIHGN